MIVSSDDEQLENIRAARRAELQQQIEAQASAQADSELKAQVEHAEAQKLDEKMRHVLTPDARARLATLALVDSETSTKVKTYLAQLSDNKRIEIPVNDNQLKSILFSLKEKQRETSIRRM